MRVTVRSRVATYCPIGGMDVNDVRVSWHRTADDSIVDAQRVHDLVAQHRGQTIYAEDLLTDLADQLRQLINRPVTVIIEQLEGHGVTVEAIWP